jgi:sugar (pentulose or hexulose) kinase
MKLTIDLGSTEFKAAIIAENSCVLGSGAYKLSYQKSGAKVELSVREAEEAFVAIVQGAVKSAGINVSDISAVGISSQAQTFTITDETGVPQIPFVSWLDQRAVKTCEMMRHEKVFANFADHSTISKLSPGMQICLLHNLRQVSPYLFTKNIKIMPLPTYFMFLLTGKYVTDCNIAAMSGLYSLKENDYWKNALHYMRISQINLPEVKGLGDEIGDTSSFNIAELPNHVPVYSCGNDQTAGAYGADLKKGDLLITLGTAQIAYCCCDSMPEPSIGLFRGLYPGGLFYAMFAENGGAIINKVIDAVPDFSNFDTFAKLAENGSIDSEFNFTINNTSNEPEWSDESANSADKALAVFTYLSKRIGAMVASVEELCDITGEIYLTGGGIKNKIWVKLIEKELNINLKTINTSPCLGVAKMI